MTPFEKFDLTIVKLDENKKVECTPTFGCKKTAVWSVKYDDYMHSACQQHIPDVILFVHMRANPIKSDGRFTESGSVLTTAGQAGLTVESQERG